MTARANDSLVSVIIPVHNGAGSVHRAIDSALAQTHDDLEVIVVDDGSTDGTLDVVSDLEDDRVRALYHGERKGAAAARNTALKDCKGRFVAFLDADDIWLPNKIDLQVDALKGRDEEWGGVYCGAIINDVDGTVIHNPAIKEGNLQLDLLDKELELGGSSTLMFKRECLDALGHFDESFQRHTDWEILVRFFDRFKLAAVRECLIVKHGYSRPPARPFAKNKEQYLKKFDSTISSFGPKRSKSIKSKHWLDVSYRYFEEMDTKGGLPYLLRALGHKAVHRPRRYSEMFMRLAASLVGIDVNSFFKGLRGER
jgi:glycosyltransferase involved in cell wall biosynthesis